VCFLFLLVTELSTHLVLGDKIIGIEEQHPNKKQHRGDKVEISEELRDAL
jgi:hypothetical protein